MTTVGVDIGGTKIAAGVVSEEGKLLESTQWPTDPTSPEVIEDGIVSAVQNFARTYDIEAVGVAACGFVGADRSTVRFAGNVAWRDHPLGQILSERLSLPVVVENDANAAGWAEFQFGAGREVSDMVMMTIGTGLGGAIIVNGKLVRGAFGGAGEIGHMVAVPFGHYCGCGHEGCLEMYASGTALTRAARSREISEPTYMGGVRTYAGDRSKLRGQDVTQAASDGDEAGLELVSHLGYWVGRGAASLAAVLDPELIVIGGGVSRAGDVLLEPARRSFKENLFAMENRPLAPLVISTFENDGGMIGAGDLARRD
ncbi:glucokinase [Bowdeniella nasicola]|uniref:Glucokinase n=1 Tax=Bowdeniella nasicola TaxID=208480 RepID=A0A1Q5Q2Y2_9ACTO|nr:ROK family glucokinase [Bowdeniella nasicola]OKL54115.1 glucokinase [Bowdeniella nasicola]